MKLLLDENVPAPITSAVKTLLRRSHDVRHVIDMPGWSGTKKVIPVVWHDPADAVATLDAILSALASPDPACADEDPEELADCLEAFRQTLQQAAARKTRFNFTIV